MAQDYEINVKVTGVDQAKTQVDGLTDSMEEVGTASGAIEGQLDKLTGGAVSGFRKAAQGTKAFITGLKLTRAAIIATGVGALVVAVTSLVAAFTKTERGGRLLKTVMAGVGAVVEQVTARFQILGGFIVDLFTEGPTAAVQNYKKAVDELPGSLQEAVEKSMELEKQSQALEDRKIKLITTMAEERAAIKALNKDAEDTTLSIAKRTAAAEEAVAKEQALLKERQEIAKREREIFEAQIDMSDTSTEERRKLAELKAEESRIEMESLELQTTLQNKLNILRTQALAEQEEATAQAEINRAREEAMENTSMMRRIDATSAMEEQRGLILQDARDKQLQKVKENNEAILAANQELSQEELDRLARVEQAKQMLRTQANKATFSILRDLSSIYDKDNEKAQKKAFQRNKAIQIAETLVNTYMAAQKAYASQIIPGDPTSIVRGQIAAGIAVASGLARVAAIKSTQFKSTGGGSGGTGAGGSVGGGGGEVQSVGVDVGTLVPTGQPTPEPVRAYVVSNEISNQQALDRELQIQTTL